MPRYTVELDGRRVVLEGDRPPTEQEVRNLLGERTSRSPIERTESRIAQRESLVPAATSARAGAVLSMFKPRQVAQRNIEDVLMPLKGVARRGQEAALQLGAGQEQVESLTAAPFVSMQAKRPIGRDLLSVMRGQRVVERGDIARNVGAPEPVASMFGLATSPETLIPGVVGAKAGMQAGGKAIAGVQDVLRFGRPATPIKPNPFRDQLIRRVQERMLRAPKIAGRTFEHGLDEAVSANPDGVVNLSESLGSYLTKAKSNPAFKSLMERQVLNHQESALVKKLIDNPLQASQLTLKDSQKVKGIFQRVNRQRFQQVDPEFIGAHLDALEVWHDVRRAQLQAFPQFKQVLRGYNETMKNFRVVKNMLKDGALEPKLLQNFNFNSQQAQAFHELATPDTIRLVKRLLKSNATRKFLGRLGVVAAAGVGVEASRRALGRPISQFFGLGTGGE